MEKPPSRNNSTTMAQFMDKNIHAFKLPSCEAEVNRLTELLEHAKNKIKVGDFLATFYPESEDGEPEMLQQKNIHDDYYTAVIKYMEIKVMAWQQFINYEKDENMLDLINESMDEWLQKGWLYFGQEDIKKQSEEAILEFKMFKVMLTQIPNKPKKPKKPRRRGGKKHKKNKKDEGGDEGGDVWDEVM